MQGKIHRISLKDMEIWKPSKNTARRPCVSLNLKQCRYFWEWQQISEGIFICHYTNCRPLLRIRSELWEGTERALSVHWRSTERALSVHWVELNIQWECPKQALTIKGASSLIASAMKRYFLRQPCHTKTTNLFLNTKYNCVRSVDCWLNNNQQTTLPRVLTPWVLATQNI